MGNFNLILFHSVTTKVTQGAKNFGSFLYSAVNKAGAKIKETVKDNVSSKPLSQQSRKLIRFLVCRVFWVNLARNKKHL